MRRLHTASRIRSLLLALVMAMAVLIKPQQIQAAGEVTWTPVQFQYTQNLQTPLITKISTPELKLTNTNSTTTTSFNVSFPDLPGGWKASATSANPIRLNPSQTLSLSVRLEIPENATAGKYVITIRATQTPATSPSTFADAILELNLNAPATPPPATGTCPEPKDPGSDIGSASLLLVDKEEGHGICTSGDEDWYKFGALGGKYYTIDITTMDKGLDLVMELYDENGKLIDADDDFPRGDDAQANARPRIQSFRAPISGFYYVRVRDTLGLGGSNLTYRIVVKGEGYGRNPPPVGSICNDIYEPDGLPEQASPIKPNETQDDHRLCPQGDADWVKFFALSGYTYYLYTDSKDKEGKPTPGSDTVLSIFNRDGQTLIDFNNNIAGGTTLDSAVSFRPAADGIYFAQVKNVGDIGDMRIAYKLTLKACPAEQPDCGPPDEFKPKTPPATANQPSSPAAQQPAAPQSPPQFLDASAPADRTQASITPNSLASQIKPVGFADPAFEQLWQRSDLPVARSRVTRGWMWGPTVRVTRTENYTEASGGQRLVLYFDKGRMELNSPAGGQGWLVSSGLLAQELISGRLQLGNSTYDNRSPADIGIVGDVNDPRAPTYASLTGLLGRAADRSGQTPRESLDRNGQVGSFTGSSFPETRLSYFATNTGHNIPSVFWNYLNARGPIYQRGSFGTGIIQDWVSMIGYPISEPYWTRVYVGGIERDVLVQAFERRILTYSPSETAGWRVQLGNIGQHYYRWRYDEDLPS